MNKLSVFALAILLTAGARAESNNTYLSLGIGRASWDVDCSGVAQCNKSPTGLRLVGGVEVDKNWAVEVFYLGLGKVKASDAGASAEIKGQALGAGVALMADFSPDWRGVLRLGLASVDVKATASAGGLSDSISKRSTQPVYGLGLRYAITPTLFAEANYERTRAKLEDETRDVGLLSAGIGWRF